MIRSKKTDFQEQGEFIPVTVSKIHLTQTSFDHAVHLMLESFLPSSKPQENQQSSFFLCHIYDLYFLTVFLFVMSLIFKGHSYQDMYSCVTLMTTGYLKITISKNQKMIRMFFQLLHCTYFGPNLRVTKHFVSPWDASSFLLDLKTKK